MDYIILPSPRPKRWRCGIGDYGFIIVCNDLIKLSNPRQQFILGNCTTYCITVFVLSLVDMYTPEDKEDTEPEWVDKERNVFKEIRDANKDGHLDLQEVRQWVLPDDYNHANAEATHLIHSADEDKVDGGF